MESESSWLQVPKVGEPWGYVKWDCRNPKFRKLYGERCSTTRWKTRLGEDDEKKGKGATCRKNKQCASGTCAGNGGGWKNGKCTDPPRERSKNKNRDGKKRHGEECRKNVECVSGECDGNMHGMKSGTCKGNKPRDPNTLMAKMNQGTRNIKNKAKAVVKAGTAMIARGALKLAKTLINKNFRDTLSSQTLKSINNVIADAVKHVKTGKWQLSPEEWINIARGVLPQLIVLSLRQMRILAAEPAEMYQVCMHRPQLTPVVILCVVTALVSATERVETTRHQACWSSTQVSVREIRGRPI